MARRASTHFSYEQRINKILNAFQLIRRAFFPWKSWPELPASRPSICIGYSAP